MPLYFRMLPFLQAYTVIVCCVGLFGNVNLIIATCRYKSLRTKLGCLLMISTISHTICLISELISVKLKLRFTQTHRDECFRFVVVYMFAVLFQSTLFLMMAIDLLLAVVMPIRHKLWQRGPYLLILCTPPIMFSSFAIFVEQLYINHENLLMCTVSLAAPRNVRFWGTIITFSTVLLAVALILITAVKVHINEQSSSSPFIRHSSNGMTKRPRSSEVKLLKSLATLIFFFICSWTLSVVLFHVAMYFDSSIGYQFHKYTFILQLPTFCQNFFVTALRSPRYARAYMEQLSFLPCIKARKSILKARQSSNNCSKPNHIAEL
ncbi:hypothetical protein GCK72_017835 [Caenorhabditis remanei]|uniref:G-protein coupled receptors family 1 profile domain-containing protein n=1 Tax=Caenorhabditis remanei TaxID=31234 RepID=A0A6A5G928_CAERE|nr:hypothetical protein GCK72_017835 [Caenorhabditis remanei]KAF1751281.1 hypothetical protein GCK72_017835 [Caenorhabditis remanei]